jgi:hypothetical protein
MVEAKLSVARDFSRHPGPRYILQGKWSGEQFRKLIVEYLNKYDKILIDLDGTSGIGSSFLDEAFGGLIRSENYKYGDLLNRLKFKSELDRSYINDIKNALREAVHD